MFKPNLDTITITTYIRRLDDADIPPYHHAFVNVLYRSYTSSSTTDMMLVVWFTWPCVPTPEYCESHITFQNVEVPSNHTASFWYFYQNLENFNKVLFKQTGINLRFGKIILWQNSTAPQHESMQIQDISFNMLNLKHVQGI